jgi:hypothetical protein
MMPIFPKTEMVLKLPASPAVLELIHAGRFDVRMGGHSPCPVSVHTYTSCKKHDKQQQQQQ